MKKVWLFLLMLFPYLLVAQKPIPKKQTIDKKQLIKNALIKNKRDECALPKYYKTELVNVTLISKAKPIYQDRGINLVNIKDSAFAARYLFLKELESYSYFENYVGYSIDTIQTKVEDTGINYEVLFNFSDSFPRILEFTIFNDPEKIDLRYNNHFEFYRGKKRIKAGMTMDEYLVEIYYWAMSKGGTVRLYHEEGYAYYDSKGKITLKIYNED